MVGMCRRDDSAYKCSAMSEWCTERINQCKETKRIIRRQKVKRGPAVARVKYWTQSIDSSSLRTRSRTSRKPPPSCLTRRGLRVIASELEDLLGPGLGGVTAVDGISSHSSPVMFTARRKKGQSEVRIDIDSCASAAESGTGEDFRMASTTSY